MSEFVTFAMFKPL